jgi:hypothetical protein
MNTSTDLDWETWIVRVGGAVIEKEAARGAEALTPLERLILCLWSADYGMRNAGDLETASAVRPGFQQEAASLAQELGLPRTRASFALTASDLEARYFDLLSDMIEEIDAKWVRGE